MVSQMNGPYDPASQIGYGGQCLHLEMSKTTVSLFHDLDHIPVFTYAGLHIINAEVIPWIVPSLLNFCPPYSPETSPLAEMDPDLLDTLVQADYGFLEETCTLIESYALDVEEFRLELARSTCHIKKDQPIQCLRGILHFIEEGSYPPIWKNPVFEESERKAKEKGFDNCKAALIKAFVEVFGEAKNEDVVWKSDDPTQPGGSLVAKMVQWIKDHARIAESAESSSTVIRDDMTICASLSLGNLARKRGFFVI